MGCSKSKPEAKPPETKATEKASPVTPQPVTPAPTTPPTSPAQSPSQSADVSPPPPVMIEETPEEKSRAVPDTFSALDKFSDLTSAAFAGNVQKIEQQLELYKRSGKNINELDESGFSAVHRAAQNGSVEALTALKGGGCKMTILSDRNESALHHAAFHRNTDAVRALLEWDVIDIVNVQEKTYGLTALHVASGRGCPDMAELIAGKGGSTAMENKAGFTAGAIAEMLSQAEAQGRTSSQADYGATFRRLQSVTPRDKKTEVKTGNKPKGERRDSLKELKEEEAKRLASKVPVTDVMGQARSNSFERTVPAIAVGA